MREIARAGIRKTIHVLVSTRRDDNLANRVLKVIRIVARDAVVFGFRLNRRDRCKSTEGVYLKKQVELVGRDGQI